MKHQKKYLDNLNKLLKKNNYDFKYSLEELSKNIDDFKKEDREDISFNLGGVINHNIYFSSMGPKKELPNDELIKLIIKYYSNYDTFKTEFKKKALSLKGSGYTYLVIEQGKLSIINLKDQDNPYNYAYTPLLCIDMWEHAYYINYENKKGIYIDNFFEIMDFSRANKIFQKI